MALLIGGAPIATGQDHTAVNAAPKVLRVCGGQEAKLADLPAVNWTPSKDATAKHVALRSILGDPMPRADSMVLLYAQGGHMAWQEISVIVVRADDGTWRGSLVGRGHIFVVGAPFYTLPSKSWTLSSVQGRLLDDILQNPCFYAEPTSFSEPLDGPPPLGMTMENLTVLTPDHRHVAEFGGPYARGLTAEVVKLITPS